MALSGMPARERRLRNSAMGLVLALGMVATGAMISEPAFAAKKEKQEKLSASKGFIAVAGPLQKTIDGLSGDDPDAAAKARAELDQAFGAIEKDDDRYFAGSLAVNLGGKLKDPSLQRRGVKAMLESGKVGESEPKYNAIAGQLAYQAKDYAEAHLYLQRAVDSGFHDDNVEALLAEAYIADNQLDKGLSMLRTAILSGRQSGNLAPDSWYRRGLASAYKANDIGKSADFGQMLIVDYPAPNNIGLAVTIIRELGNFGSQETLDLMRLMGRTKSYAEQRDYVEYIQAADPRRLPGEVMDIVNAGLASGRLSASDPFVADAKQQASSRIDSDKASLPGFEADARKSNASEATVTGAGDAFLSYGDAAKAEELYTIAMNKPGADIPRVLTRLGIAQVDEGKYAQAEQTFAKVTGPRVPIAKLWSGYAQAKAKQAAAASSPAPAPAAPAE